MILTKEKDGQIYVADIGPSKGPDTMGDILKPWTPTGPGERPVVSSDGTTHYLAFEYLGHVYVRKLSSTTWPPLVIDPTTYTPNISLEEPHDALTLGSEVTPGQVRGEDQPYLAPAGSVGPSAAPGGTIPHSGALKRVTGIIRDVVTGQYSIQLQRDTTPALPSPATLQAWRVYVRPVGGAWGLVVDWQTEVGPFTLSNLGSLRYDVALTFGDLQDPATHQYRESCLGSSLHVDSTVEPLTVQIGEGDQFTCGVGQGALSGAFFEGSQMFYSVPGEDRVPVALGGQGSFSEEVCLTSQSSPFLTGNSTRGWADFADQLSSSGGSFSGATMYS